jgi:tetratricopeptide (TPR) repeat protein
MEGTDLKRNNLLLYVLILSIFIMGDSGTCIDASKNYDSMGSKLYSAGNYSEAMDYFNKSIDQNSSYIDAWVHKGNAQKALRQYNASLLSYNRATASNSKNQAAWSGLSDSYSAGKDLINASGAAAVLTRLDPKNKGYWFKNGTLLQLRGDFDRARPDFDQAIALDPKYKDAIYRKAISEVAVNDTDQAIELLDQVIASDDKYKYAYNAKGQALEAQGKYELAIAAYDRALEIDPKWTLALMNKVHAMIESGNKKEAVDIFLRM